MGNPVFKLEEQLSDLRSDQIAYKITIENPDTRPLRLLSVEPRVPVGGTLIGITDTSLAEANAKRSQLIQELNLLLNRFLFVASEDYRKNFAQSMSELYREVFSAFGLVKFYAMIIFNNKSVNERINRDFNALSYKIMGAIDARAAFDRWLAHLDPVDPIKSLFEEKVIQLEAIELKANGGLDGRFDLNNIEAGSSFNATYVLKFKRAWFEPKKYQVSFDAVCQYPDAASAQSISTATNIQISPFPFSLSLVAIVAGILGSIVKIAISSPKTTLADVIYNTSGNGEIFIAPFIALVLFNVYEHTSIGRGLSISVSWRSALLVGTLCGIAQDRILAALKSLIGA